MIITFQRSITVRVRTILAVVTAVVSTVTYDHYVSEEYYSESEEDEDDSRSSSRCSTPSNLSFEVQSPPQVHGADVGSSG